MAVTGTRTVREMCTRALRLAGVTSVGEDPAAEDAEEARQALNDMLKGWQGQGFHLWTVAGQSLALTANTAVYTLNPVRPLAILSARLKRGPNEVTMFGMTRDEYDNLPNKLSRGSPVNFHYDRQREAARFLVWPVLAAANGETVEITYSRELEDIAGLNDVIDVPGEWWEVVAYNLAARMMEVYGVSDRQTVITRAQLLLEDALGFDREGSVYFGPEV